MAGGLGSGSLRSALEIGSISGATQAGRRFPVCRTQTRRDAYETSWSRRSTVAPAWEKAKKADLAAIAEREIGGTGWLPAPLKRAA
jgi:hypothetical protein